MQIQKTTKYDLFKVVKGNRTLNKGHLNNLSVSVMQNNLLEYNPIIVNKRMEVVDGQHRLEVAKRNGLPIYYVVAEKSNLNDVQSLNSAQKIWGMQDYIDSFIAKGNENYEVLDLFIKTYELPVSTSVSLLSGHGGGREHAVLQQFKRGEFVVTTMRAGEDFANKINDIRIFCEKGVGTSAYFIRACISIHKKNTFNKAFSHEQLVKKFGVWKKKITRFGAEKDYLRLFEEVYNFKSKSEYVRLF
jgi:uncharacterized protein YggU (UPF0235/DUF167 family)